MGASRRVCTTQRAALSRQLRADSIRPYSPRGKLLPSNGRLNPVSFERLVAAHGISIHFNLST